ncbi:MAG: hypothetical protein ACKO3T_08105 [Planctomycetaceae bacterium]
MKEIADSSLGTAKTGAQKRCGRHFSSGFQILRAETAAAGTFAKTLGVNLAGCSSRDPSKLHGG